ncbi:GNAT family N-acetyltransferase [Streptococcus anginosus]|uniref:GNAT family N-acetyltransferase n=1 Tax=Streptococcus anginosus TaxID=1328 RepID=UPI000E451C93|nr:GNAT family N-acetyltransferase [Streptococcus anginosus]RGN67185.1 GNAT family N-acetyltransferase [Streptococcus anginosus]
MAELELLIREAEPQDAKSLLDFLNQVGKESDYMTLDDAIAGLVSITADFHERIRHIGQVFIVVKRAFWNQGLGKLLLEEAIDWAENSGVIRRLELTVQVRNERAVHLYQAFGFEIEGIQKRGAYLAEGKFLDVYLMGKLID